MATLDELQGDQHFMSATPADQIKFLSETDPSFKAAHPDDQAAFLAHLTHQPTGAEASAPVKDLGGALDVAGEHYEKGTGVGSALGRLGTMVPSMARSAYHAVADAPKNEEEQATQTSGSQSPLGIVGGRGALATKRMLLDPSVAATEHVNQMAQTQEDKAKAEGGQVPLQGKIAKYAGRGVAAIPMVGPYALNLGERAGKGDVSGALTESAGMALAPEALHESMPGGALPGAAEAGARPFPAADSAVRGAGTAIRTVGEKAPDIGAVVGGTVGALKGNPASAYFEMKGGHYAGKMLGKPLEKLGTKMEGVGLSPEEKSLQHVEKAYKTAQEAADKAGEEYHAYDAGREQGIPAPKSIMDAHEKAQKHLDLLTQHLQAAQDAVSAAKNPAEPEKPITAEDVAAARPEAATPTDEELKIRQENLMGKMEKASGIETPAPVAQNVKTPGQVQPETFPQEPTEAPRVDETTQMRPLAGGKGTIVGRKPLQLTEGTPEAAPAAAAPEAPKTPLGEILPPERPAKPGRLGSLRVSEGGKVVDTEPNLQQKIEEGLQGKAKPVATPAPRAFEEVLPKHEGGTEAATEPKKFEDILPKHEDVNDKGQTLGFDFKPAEDIGRKVRGDKEAPRATERREGERNAESDAMTPHFSKARKELGEDATFEQIEARAKELKAGREPGLVGTEKELKNEGASPEDMTKAEQVVTQHTDQELARLGKKYGVDEADYDFSKRDEKRHRVERDDFVNEVLSKMPEKDVTNIARLSDEFNKKDTTLWSEAERTNMSKAQRARAIMQEHEGGPKSVSGGSQAADTEIVGTDKGAKEDTDFMAQAKKAKPDATLSEQVQEAQELKRANSHAEAHNENGGATIHPKDGNLDGKPRFSVGGEPEFDKPALRLDVEGDKLTPEQLKEFNNRPDVKAALKAHPDASVGSWYDKDDDKSVVELVKTPVNKAEAIEMGKKNNQKAIWDLAKREEIPTGGTGESLKPSADNIKLSDEELLKKGYTQADLDAGKHLPTVSGGAPSKKMPTGDELIKKYGESDGDPAHTAFILSDGRGVAQTGTIHDEMLGGKATDDAPRREQFINEQGAVRMRSYGVYGDRQFNMSIPKEGITTEQLEHLQKMAPQMSTGQVYVEVADPKNMEQVRNIAYGKTTPESLEKAIRDIAPIKNAKGSPVDEFGNPTVSGGSPSAAAKTAEAKLPKLAEQHLLPEEKEGVSKSPQQLERFVGRMAEMPKVREFTDAALRGAGERKWYQRSTQAFDAMSKEAPNYFDQEGDRDKFIGMLAAGSPQQSVAMNLREALRVWTTYVDNGRPTGAALEKLLSRSSDKGGFTLPGAKIPNAMKALAGEPLWPDITKNSNFKVPSFRDNLTGMLKRVTNDGWMALFSGMDAKDISSAHSYHPISVMTRAAADELGWEPAEAQAAIWAFIKTLTEKGTEASEDPHQMRQYSEDFADIIQHDPDTRALLKDMGVNHAELDKRLAAIESKPEPDTSGGRTTAEDSSRRASERVEKSRGNGTIPATKTGLLNFGESEAEGRGDDATSFNPKEIEAGKGEVKVTPLSERGNKTILTVKVDGERAGQVSLTPTPDLGEKSAEISTSQLGEAFRGKGHGTEVYRQVIDYAKSKGLKTLYSDDSVSMRAENVWQSLVRKGDAKWDSANKRYKIAISPLGKIKT